MESFENVFDLFWDNLGNVVLFFGILVGTMVVAYIFSRAFKKFILDNALIMRNDPTNYKFLRHAIVGIIYLIGIGWAVYMMPNLRAVASSLLAGAGILAVAVGFASQHALSNVISGVFIVVFKPFRVNDRLSIKDTMNGIVEDITLRHTVIRDFQNRRIIIPNSIISNEVILNADMAEERVCRWIHFGISYDSDIDKARAIIREEALNHPLRIDGRSQTQIEEGADELPVRVITLGDFSVNLRAWVWAKDSADAFLIECELLESVKKRFDKEGIEIPFPYRTLVYKKDLENGISKGEEPVTEID